MIPSLPSTTELPAIDTDYLRNLERFVAGERKTNILYELQKSDHKCIVPIRFK